MDRQQAYFGNIARIAGRIRAYAPPDLIERFAAVSGFDHSSYRRCTPAFDGTITAVDGSNALLLDAGSFAIAAIRAVECSYAGGECIHRRTTPLQVVSVGGADDDYAELFEECFGCRPRALPGGEDPAAAASVIRDTFEYWVALELAWELSEGDLLVLDGALRVSHASHHEILEDLLNVCNHRGVLLAAVTKRTSLTWGNGHPILPAAAGLAAKLGVGEPWYVKIPADQAIPDRQQQHTWQQRGSQYVALLHRRAARPFKIELPEYLEDEMADRAFSALAAYADDGRVTGYPYPLLDAHLHCRIGIDVAEQVRHDLIRGICGLGMSMKEYSGLFGDYHDEFNRY
ncbi:MAG: DNA double-strand break repair nuclease NurA [Methanomicrobiaceae archaeon]|uniref:Single-stranded exonuclease associated with rad50/mre11 complex n=1 Tax=hydrocarbon metagenome TaxID=938273 RepID=A0A0W8FGU6_9ZZZZ|nr:DNA double-strand break repair nuclease NurA [Methanomicrobiaceae archaeon]